MQFSERRCFGCMNIYTADSETCPVCGYPSDGSNPDEYLPAGMVLAERYTVGRVLSFSGTTATYIAYDNVGDCPVYLREFMPEAYCRRTDAGAVCPHEQNQEEFDLLMEEFEKQGRMLAKLRDLSLMLPVYDLFKQNGTAYTVSEYLEPHTLTELLAQNNGRLSWNDTRKLFLPFLSSLISCHTAGLYHLAICPQNLLLDESGRLRLTGFDLTEVRRENDLVEPQLATGYAAPEQYTLSKPVGAAADVYGVAAAIFRALTGSTPPDGAHRADDGGDLFMPTEVANALPEHVAETLADALHPDAKVRIPTLTELRDRLSTGMVVSALAQEAEAMTSGEQREKKMPKSSTGKKYAILLCALLAIILIVVGVILWGKFRNPTPKDNNTSSLPVPTATETEKPTATESQGPVSFAPDLSDGKVDYYALPIEDGQRVSDLYPVVIIGYQYSDSVPAGYIVAQNPVAGAPVPDGTTISVYLSAGKARTAVPDVTGWKAEHAKIYLEALGFRVEISKGADTSVDVGCVFGTWPEAGTEPINGNKVTLRVNNTPTTTATQEVSDEPSQDDVIIEDDDEAEIDEENNEE